jgi:hypothetical protein
MILKLYWLQITLPAVLAVAAFILFRRRLIPFGRWLSRRLKPEEPRTLLKKICFWSGAILLVVGLVCTVAFAPKFFLWLAGIHEGVISRDNLLPREEYAKLLDEYRKTVLQALAGVFAILALYYTYRRVRVSEQSHITERYTRAIEQLGAVRTDRNGQTEPNIEVRLGAIYALERIAQDSPRDHWPIMEVLTAYVRQNAPIPKDLLPQEQISEAAKNRRLSELMPKIKKGPPTEIQAILTVLGRRRRGHRCEREGQRLDLTRCDLRGANLSGIMGRRAHFEKARFNGSHLEGTNFWCAHVERASFIQAHIEEANFKQTHVERATFFRAHVIGTSFNQAHVERAIFFTDGLTVEQFQNSIDWKKAKFYNEEFKRQLQDACDKLAAETEPEPASPAPPEPPAAQPPAPPAEEPAPNQDRPAS